MRTFLAAAVLLPSLAAAEGLPQPSDLLRQARLETAAVAVPQTVPAGPQIAPAGPLLTGHFPEGAFPDRERVIADIWSFVKTLGKARADLPPPTIYFSPFDPAQQDADWTAWQKTWAAANADVYVDWLCSVGRKKYPEVTDADCARGRDRLKIWLASHPEVKEQFPFPPVFRAFHYDGTDRIQITTPRSPT
jgi:hypothetical protein